MRDRDRDRDSVLTIMFVVVFLVAMILFSVWRYNLKREKVDYILVAKPWPFEFRWLLKDKDNFQLIFSDKECKIFKLKGGSA